MSSVEVMTAGGAYRVDVGSGTLPERLHAVLASLGVNADGRVFIVADAGVPAPFIARAADAACGLTDRVTIHTVVPSERAKSLATLADLLSALAASRHERRDPVIAIGGGIVGDVAGFLAAVYRRGCPVVQCPTTLLAMVDASVGGKTGVNLEGPGEGGPALLKNFVGAFHQPGAVLIDTEALGSLPERVFRCGLAECAKHAMIAGRWGDPDLLAWTQTNADRILARDPGTLAELIVRNVSVKARVVGSDERELAASGGRAELNLGHTFGHAIEPIPGLAPPDRAGIPGSAPLQHGEAVALGCVAAATTAATLGLVDDGAPARVRALIERLGLPSRIAGLPGDRELLDAMMDDKKVSAGRLRLVLPDGETTVRVVTSPDERACAAGLGSIRLSAG